MNNFTSLNFDTLNALISAGTKLASVTYDSATVNTQTFKFTGIVGVGTFVVGETLYYPAAGALSAATKTATITRVAGTTVNPIISYRLPAGQTNFVNTDTVKGATSTATCTAAAPTSLNPETIATDDGWVQYYRETSGTWIEVMYTK